MANQVTASETIKRLLFYFSWQKYLLQEITWSITKTSLFKYTEKFTTNKWKFSDKNSDIFHISAQNIDCGYSLEPPRRGGSNEYPQSMFLADMRPIMYTPVNPSFTIQKWGFRGSTLYRHVFVMTEHFDISWMFSLILNPCHAD